MPCDGSIRVLSDSDDIEFMIANDVHKVYGMIMLALMYIGF